MKNLNLFKSNVSGMDREWIENESGLTRHHGKLWKHVAMIFAVLVMSVANVGMAWGTDYTIDLSSFTESPTGTYTKEGLGGLKCKNYTNIFVEVPSASTSGTISWKGSGSDSGRFLYIYKTNGTVKDETRKIVYASSYGSVDFTSSDIKTNGGKYYLVFGTTDDWKAAGVKYVLSAPSSTWYVKGGWNSWGTTDNFKGSGTEVSATVNITTAGSYEFKIYNSSGDKWYGNGGNIGCNVSGWTFSDGASNCKFFASETGNYTFTFNTSTKALSVTYPTAQGKYYYKNTGSWGAVYVYRFKGGINNGWPGTQVVETETVCGDEFYFTYADPGTTLIFDNNSGNQTGNMAASGNAGKYVAGTSNSWTAFTYNVTYDKNGGTGTAPTDATNYSSGASVPVKDNSNLTKSGYYFAGWNTKADGSGDTYVLGQTFSITSCTTLYAKWNAVSCPDGSVEGTVFSLTSPTGTVSVAASSSATITSSQATVSKGLATLVNGQGSAKSLINSSKFSLPNGNTVIRLNLGCALAVGDVISFADANYKFMVSKTNSTSPGTNNFVVQPSKTGNCTIPAGSNLIGLKEVFVVRAESSTTTCTAITITRPAGCDAPSALAAATPTAKGITLTVTDANDVNNYEFYVHTSSTTPEAGATATHSVSSAKSLTITNLVAGTTYYAWARTKCSASNKSDWVALTGNTFTTSTVTVTHTLTNVEKTSGATTAGGSDYTAKFAAVSGYSMPTPTVTVGGSTLSAGNYTWTPGTGTLTIPAGKINGNIVITLNSVAAAPSSVAITGNWLYFAGETIELTATPTGGNGPVTYQWYKGGKENGNAIEGATTATYTKATCAFEDAGSYYCKVTCGGSQSTWGQSGAAYNVKIPRLYVKTGRNDGVKSDFGNVDFTRATASTATASITLGSNWDYCFNIADGCGHYYGNAGTMQYNNYGPWTTNVNNQDCGLRTTNGATYVFTIDYSNWEQLKTTVTFPSSDQAADKIIYFDNQTVAWSTLHYRIGRADHTQATPMTKVPGTNNLYTVTTAAYNNAAGWHIANNAGWTGSNSIYRTYTNDDKYSITYATAHEGGAVTDAAVTVTPTTSRGTGADAGINDNCTFYNYEITTGMKTQNVAISDYSNGTITVNYVNTSNEAATLTSGNADLAHSVILTSITAVADEGYDASAITINGGAYSANYVVTGNTTIAASFTLKTYTISYNKGTNGTGSKASETKTHGVNFTLPGSTFTYGGHAQDGWSTSDGGALAYALSGSYTTNAAQEFFPHWKCNTPSITDNGDNTVSITVPSGTTVRYTTDGTDPSSSTGTVYSTTFSIAADCTVKAIAYQSNCTDSEIASQACDYTAPANFQMIANSSAASDATLALNEYIAQGSKNCVTLTGGTAQYQGADGKTMKVNKSNGSGTTQYYGWYFNNSGDKIVVTMTGHILQVGSVISVEGYGANGNGITANTSTSFVNSTGAQQQWSASHTVVAGDTHLVGKNVITFDRYNSCRIFSITISNCQAATPCTTPTLPSLSNQAGCSYSAWNATPSNASTISAAGESISYSWKKGATEKATTASYTPDADGTDYTVTVTVSKAGKISTSVTSSALTATKYAATSISTQPTTAVDATVDVNYTLGSGMVATGEGDLSYQWYSYTSSGGAGEASIGSATSATYTTSKAVAGTYYYKVKVTADCGTVASNMITVTVSEPPCFSATNLVKNGDWSDVAVDGSIDAAKVVGTITGGTIKNTGSAALGSNSKSANAGLVMDGSSKQVTVTLSGSNHLTVGSVITLTAAVSDGAKSGTSKTSGLVVSGYDCSPVNKASETAYDSFTQSYTVTEESSLVEANSFTIALKSGLDKTYLHAITVTGCEDCTPIDPELSYSKTTIWMDDADLTATPSLDKGGSTGSATYVSNNTDVATVNESTGVVTAVARGTATIRATIAADATHCGKTATCDITIKEMDCEWTVIAGVTATSKNAGTPEGALIASSDGYKVNLQDWKSPDGGCGTGGKIGGDNQYIYLTLKSGEYFKDGDKVIVNIAKVPGVGDSKLHIYDGTTTLNDESTMIGTSGTPSCGENEIVLSGVPANTSSITLHRGNGPTSATLQNPYVTSMKVKRYVCPDSKEFLPTASSGNWNATANWIGSNGRGASLPTIDDRVVISKPVTVDIADAKAKDVLVNQYSGATGKITVSAGKALIIAEKMQKTTTGSNRIATAAADVIINSTRAAGTGALVMGSHDGTNAATVNFETKVKYDNGYVNQYLGSPFSDETPYVDYEIQLYKFVPQGNGSHGWWNKLSYGDEMVPFMGYNQLSNNTSGNYLNLNGRTGHLNASSNVEFTIANGKMYYNSSWPENMFANSWTAPIHIDQFIDDDFTNVKQSIYIFNAGTPEQYAEGGSTMEGDADNESAGTYTVIPVKSASDLADLGAVTTVIPAMQAFSVMATSSSPSLTLNFSRLVYTPATTGLKIEPTRAPKRNEERPDAMRLRVRGENGWTTNAYILGREDFTEGYDDGWDGEYMEGDGSAPQLYSATEEGYFVVNCVPEIEGTLMAFHPGSADNAYTFSFVYKGTETWYLNDLKEQQSTLISNETSYPFVSVAGDKAARFVISKTPINKIVTGIDETNGEKDAKVHKLLIDDHIYIIRGGKMYTADGALVK